MELRVLGLAGGARRMREVVALGGDVAHRRILSVATHSNTLLEGVIRRLVPEEWLVGVQ